MLIALIRVLFVLLAITIGVTSGKYFYRPLFGDGLPQWYGGAIGFGVAITLVAAEQAFRRRFTRSLVAFLVGLGTGLLLASLLLTVVRQVIQDEDLYRNLDLPLALVTVYLVMITVLRNADRLRVIVPFVEFRGERSEGGALILDPQALADGRLPRLLRAGLVSPRIIVHRRILEHWQTAVAGEDVAQRARAQRALDGMQALRQEGLPPLEIDDTEIPNTPGLSELVIRLARLENGRIVTSDRELARRCNAEGVPLIDLQALAIAMVPEVSPGTSLSVLIERPGEGKGQGVGFLDDGSMVVIAEGDGRVGQTVRCTVRRLHATANGRMVFADIDA